MADQEQDAGNGVAPPSSDPSSTDPPSSDPSSTDQPPSDPSALPEDGAGNETASYEELQQQLQEMEERRQEMAAELEHINEPQLDSNLAVIDEQFRQSFDERFSVSTGPKPRLPQIWEDQTEILRTNKIFREVSRCLGDEWRPLFDELMSPYPADVVAAEKAMVESQQPIIQGYKALMAWKEVAGQNFTIIKLIDALRNNNMDDIADATLSILDEQDKPKSKDKPSKPVQRRKSDVSSRSKSNSLDNRRMLLIAKKIGGDWETLGKELGIPDEELAEIREAEGLTYQGAFKVLWAWRQLEQGCAANNVESLKAALEKVEKKHVADTIEAST